jgi:ABC-2 type transport system ATP-binding protein
MVTTHYMDEAEHCQSLAFIQRGRLVAMGSPGEIKAQEMRGHVLEVACDQPDVAIPVLRQLGLFEEVALYGALIHVVTEDPDAHRALIQGTLRDQGVHITAIDSIAPSLEDVFIASARHQETEA